MNSLGRARNSGSTPRLSRHLGSINGEGTDLSAAALIRSTKVPSFKSRRPSPLHFRTSVSGQKKRCMRSSRKVNSSRVGAKKNCAYTLHDSNVQRLGRVASSLGCGCGPLQTLAQQPAVVLVVARDGVEGTGRKGSVPVRNSPAANAGSQATRPTFFKHVGISRGAARRAHDEKPPQAKKLCLLTLSQQNEAEHRLKRQTAALIVVSAIYLPGQRHTSLPGRTYLSSSSSEESSPQTSEYKWSEQMLPHSFKISSLFRRFLQRNKLSPMKPNNK